MNRPAAREFSWKHSKDIFFNVEAFEIDKSLAIDFPKRHKSFLSAPTTDTFDCIIGNPPYIRWKNLEPELKEELTKSSLWNAYFKSQCDYLFIFILKSIEQLNENGELIFICTDYWLNTTHPKSLRNYMVDSGFFESINHFNEAALFETFAKNYPNIGNRLRPRLPELSKRYSYGKNLQPQQFAFPRNQQLFEKTAKKSLFPARIGSLPGKCSVSASLNPESTRCRTSRESFLKGTKRKASTTCLPF